MGITDYLSSFVSAVADLAPTTELHAEAAVEEENVVEEKEAVAEEAEEEEEEEEEPEDIFPKLQEGRSYLDWWRGGDGR